jgi:hypothetical protein
MLSFYTRTPSEQKKELSKNAKQPKAKYQHSMHLTLNKKPIISNILVQ